MTDPDTLRMQAFNDGVQEGVRQMWVQFDSTQRENEELKKRVQEAIQKHFDDNQYLKQKEKELTTEVQYKHQYIEALNAKTNDCERMNRNLQEITQQMTAIENHNSYLLVKTRQLEQQLAENAQKTTIERQQFWGEMQEKDSECRRIKEYAIEFETKCNKYEQLCVEKEEQLMKNDALLKQIKTKGNQMVITMRQLIQEYTQSKVNLSRNQTELKSMKTNIEQLKEEISRFKTETESKEIELHETKVQLSGLIDERKQLKSNIRKLNSEVTELERMRKEDIEKASEMRESTFQEGKEAGYQIGISQSQEELKRIKSIIIDKENAIEELKANVKESENDLNVLKDHYNECQIVLVATQQRLQSHSSDAASVDDMKREINLSKRKIDDLNHELAFNKCSIDKERLDFKDKTRQLKKEIQILQRRINDGGSDGSSKKEWLTMRDESVTSETTDDETIPENLDIKHRPINIAKLYQRLLSESWQEAKHALDKVNPENAAEMHKVKMLFHIMMLSEQEASTLYAHVVRGLKKTLHEPFHGTLEELEGACAAPSGTSTEHSLSPTALAAIAETFRTHSDRINLSRLTDQVMASLKTKYADNASAIPAYFDLAEVTDFIQEMARLAWKMAIQVPPLNFDASQMGDAWSDDGSLEAVPGSKSLGDGAVIHYYKAPKLMHGHMVLVKRSVSVE